jgi:hypothetical protein
VEGGVGSDRGIGEESEGIELGSEASEAGAGSERGGTGAGPERGAVIGSEAGLDSDSIFDCSRRGSRYDND